VSFTNSLLTNIRVAKLLKVQQRESLVAGNAQTERKVQLQELQGTEPKVQETDVKKNVFK
jgi:hypothetical protein